MKVCTKCIEEKDESLFCKKKDTKDGLSSQCKPCGNAYSLKWRKDNPIKAKDSMRGYTLRKYAISDLVYSNMLEAQNGLCKICGKTNPDNKTLSIDHNHETGEVRGLLCSKCNLALGGFRDSVDLLKKAIEYLGG